MLQKLCQLPFQYFSHPHLIKVLFPSLISACYNNQQNKVMLQQEMSCVLLATFIQVCYMFSYRQYTYPGDCRYIDVTLPQTNLHSYIKCLHVYFSSFFDKSYHTHVHKSCICPVKPPLLLHTHTHLSTVSAQCQRLTLISPNSGFVSVPTLLCFCCSCYPPFSKEAASTAKIDDFLCRFGWIYLPPVEPLVNRLTPLSSP